MMPARRASSLRNDLILALGLVALCVTARMLPHVSNFSPVAAAALFAGAVLGRRWLAIAIPVIAMLIGDLVQGFYDLRVMAVVYAALALPAVRDGFLREVKSTLILQPGPAALTDGLDALMRIVAEWALRQPAQVA